MTKAQFRRWVVKVIEVTICMTILSVGCVVTALAISACLRLLGVAY